MVCLLPGKHVRYVLRTAVLHQLSYITVFAFPTGFCCIPPARQSAAARRETALHKLVKCEACNKIRVKDIGR